MSTMSVPPSTILSTAAEAAARRREVDVHGQRYVLTGYVGSSPTRGRYVEGNERNDDGRPQGFLVAQPPAAVTPPHFHETDQFQVFVGGSGYFGKREVEPLTVQFAAAHTPYGPIRAGDGGIEYFTLRRAWDPGAKYMPAMRDRLVRGRQRQRLAASAARPALPARGVECDVLIAAEPDGLYAAIYRLAPHARIDGPQPCAGDGQYQIVLDGSLADPAAGRLSVRWVPGAASPPAIEAGSEGLALLVLQFPATAARARARSTA